jgi:hypothetical protein
LETGERFVLTVAADGMPVWWPNLYCQIRIRERCISFSAMRANMSAVCAFHNICAELGIDVDARVESLELFCEEEIAALRDELRNFLRNSEAHGRGSSGKRKTVRSAHWKSRLTAVASYIVWRCDPVIDRMSLRDERLPEARRRLVALILGTTRSLSGLSTAASHYRARFLRTRYRDKPKRRTGCRAIR